jgi:uncharacterized cupin superfamily protein
MTINIKRIHKKNLISPSSKDTSMMEGKKKYPGKGKEDFYPKNIIRKPWGLEYSCYKNEHIDIWEMQLFPGHSTSFHCHPGKDVLKIILEGEIKLITFHKEEKLAANDYRLIKGNTAHRSINTGKNIARIVEIESPPDKKNLIRFEDKYGRRGTPYASQIFSQKNKTNTPMKNLFNSKRKELIIENSLLYHTSRNEFANKICNKVNEIFLIELKGNVQKNLNADTQARIIGKKFNLVLAIEGIVKLNAKGKNNKLLPGEGYLVEKKEFSIASSYTSKSSLLLML